MNITVSPLALLDPQGPYLVAAVPLAVRPARLAGKTVLLLDNTQLTFGLPVYGPIYRWLAQQFKDAQGAACIELSLDLLVGGKDRLGALADQIVAMQVDAVVLALCHAGVTQPTTLLAAELERRGKPCVLLCSSLGQPLAQRSASTYVPGLPLVLVAGAQGAPGSDEFGQQETAAYAPLVVAALTTPAEVLKAGALSATVNTSGEIVLADRSVAAEVDAQGGMKVRLDPACFALELYEKLCADDMSDGFPVIPPTRQRVNAMLRYTDLAPDTALVEACPPSGAAITVRALAVNAVMAGCRDDYFPIVIAVMQAMADPAYRLFQAAITTHSAGNAIIVSGPLTKQIGLHGGPGCLGPGFRANATIGRAITLTIINVARAIPAKSDLSVFGSPAEYSYCVAEDCAANPWSPLHADLYDSETTSVTVAKCEGPANVAAPDRSAGPAAFVRSVASTAATLGGSNMVNLGPLLLFINPGYARMIADAGWSKQDIKQCLFEFARHPVAEVRNEAGRLLNFPPHYLSFENVPVLRSPDDVVLLVCGGTGRHSMVAVPWGLSAAASRPVVFKDGTARRVMEAL